MSKQSPTIPKQPTAKPAEDYYRLRREGIGFIEEMGSSRWTDYNTHDPGITILEALCYALTDLAYRTGWDIRDILAPASLSPDPKQPFANQPFFTARDILTVNPWTPDDFRRLLIDLAMVRNGWVICKECACDLDYYAWCEKDDLRLSFKKPADTSLEYKPVTPLGLYEVLLELESDAELGDLNDRKIEGSLPVVDPDAKTHPVTMELRFPDWGLAKWLDWQRFLDPANTFSFTLTGFGATKSYNLLSESDTNKRNQYLRDHWNTVFYVDYAVTLSDGGPAFTIDNAALCLFSDSYAKSQTTLDELIAKLEDATADGFLPRYLKKIQKTQQALSDAKATLGRHRNLDEDYCRVRIVDVEDIAVCADVEAAPDADIEQIQARIWFELESYFNPPVKFYTLKELMAAGVAVEDIFSGPELANGFIKNEDLAAAGLKTVLRVSDIINRLMDIEGVLAVNNLLLTKYDAEGRIIKGAADPTWVNDQPVFDAEKISAAWLLFVTPGHQPRLYHNRSRFLFSIGGLPFLPRLDEAYDTLTQLRGEAERPKIFNTENDLPIPAGTFRDPEEYFPVQNGFPLAYGIGPEGLPAQASGERIAQARQLKAYLMVYEQLLGNALAQVAHTADLFSLAPDVQHTYFAHEFSEESIHGYTDITSGLDATALAAMLETTPEFYQRRHRFLDHIMARFGEQFNEYSLLLKNYDGRPATQARLIEDKISFLKAYPLVSHDRAKAINAQAAPCGPDNIAGLKKRISLLLGYPDLHFAFDAAIDLGGDHYQLPFQLLDRNDRVWLEGDITVTAASADSAPTIASRRLLQQMTKADSWSIVEDSGTFRLNLDDDDNNLLGQYPQTFEQKTDAEAYADELSNWSSNERAVVVEHLLLRPKFPGDALYPACTDGACKTCGNEDPYSFKLTFVMPGWTAPFNSNMNMRDFAERTIREETPSHLLPKICWVGNDGFISDPCDAVIDQLATLLTAQGLTSDGLKPTDEQACDCAAAIYAAYSSAFESWYADKLLDFFHSDALEKALETEFDASVDVTTVTCAVVLTRPWRPRLQPLWSLIFIISLCMVGNLNDSKRRGADGWRPTPNSIGRWSDCRSG